jgi:lysophospholipase L1-like esterase
MRMPADLPGCAAALAARGHHQPGRRSTRSTGRQSVGFARRKAWPRAAAASVTGLLVAAILTLGPVGRTIAAESAVAAAAAPVPAELLLSARRVAVIGDSITADGRWVAALVAWMERQGSEAEVIAVGLPSETVSGLSEEGHADGRFPRPDVAERLERVLRVVRPDVVLACYGMNCGIYQPLDEARFARFRDGMERLHATIEAAGAKVIHLTPPVYDARPDKPGPAAEFFPTGSAGGYDDVLAAYGDWLLSRRADGWLVIDVHGPMKAALRTAREADATVVFAPDTVHPNDAGHWALCRAVLAGLGDETLAAAETPTALAAFLPDVTTRLRLLRDAYLTAAGHLRPGVKPGLPIAEAEAKAAVLTHSIRARRLQLMGAPHASGEWRMPIEWPRPPVVDPGPAPVAPAVIPADAVVLFDGTNLDAWTDGDRWTVADGLATVRDADISTRDAFGDCHLHVEFRTPADTKGKGQQRGNSGVFLMGRYEIQILDSFEDGTDDALTYPDGQCGAIYKQRPPAVNASRRPGEWQTYDILFTAPRFDPDGGLLAPGRVSVLHNGIAIHVDAEILGDTAWHAPPAYHAHPERLPLRLQNHGNPVQFRSIWVRPAAPVQPRPVD